jgi:deazaflavin-dependent oxidoreductase (nitroreductase family)
VPEIEDRNTRITREFRENDGKVGGPFENATIVLLYTTGKRSGKEHMTPLVAQPLDGGRYAIFASKGGSPVHPDWYFNLRANPQVTYEVAARTGTKTVQATARVARGEERERIWSKQKQERPNFAEYERKTTRQIPVVVLEPAS